MTSSAGGTTTPPKRELRRLRGRSREIVTLLLTHRSELDLSDLIETVPADCAAALRAPTPGNCQLYGAGLGALQARSAGWVGNNADFGPYEQAAVVEELAAAGFPPAAIVSMFNGNLSLATMTGHLRRLFPFYEATYEDEAPLRAVEQRWHCPLRCCQPRKNAALWPSITHELLWLAWTPASA